MKKRVCVIGAGAAGLVAIRHVSQNPEFSGIVFEESDSIGGVWVYREKSQARSTSPNPNQQRHGPMYKNMRTNLPRQVMGIPGFPFPDSFSANHSLPSYMHHSEVLEYLHSFADHFKLRQYVQHHRRVIDLRPNPSTPIGNDDDGGVRNPFTPTWLVKVQHMDTEDNGEPTRVEEYEFDAVIICNGHFSKPQITEIPNIEEFKGQVFHSIDYDDAEPFVDKTVIIVGCGPSGIDISFEVAKVASQVIISTYKEPLTFPLPANTSQVSKIKYATHDGFVCENGDKVIGDILIICTGYLFDFPFLSSECGIIVENCKRVSPLYHGILNAHFPNLCFIGIHFHVAPFLLFDCQGRYFVKFLEGSLKLPAEELMLSEVKDDRLWKESLGYSDSWSHHLGDRQWKYFEDLANEAEFSIPQYLHLICQIYRKTNERRMENSQVYKDDVIIVTDAETNSFQYIECPYLSNSS